ADRMSVLHVKLTSSLPSFSNRADRMSSLHMQLASSLPSFSNLNLTVALPSISMPVPDWLSANITVWEILAQLPGMGDTGADPSESESLLRPGKQLFNKGYRAKHPVIIIPGFVTSGLELWEGKPCARKYFRQRMWGTLSMMQTYLKNSACWFEHMSLDPETGLDPEGVKIRAVQGLEAVDFFIQGYWVWGKLVEALADVGYDTNNLITAAFDWRLAIPLMEARDGWFTRLRYQIESLLEVTGQKVVLTSHSYGENVARSFMHWANERQPGWLEEHVEAHVAIAGTVLGVPKAVTSVLSGEMRDTAQLGALASYLTNNLIPREARVKLWRSWGSALAMFPVGGPKIWGNGTWAPDDTKEMRDLGRTFGAFLTTAPLKDAAASAAEKVLQQQKQQQHAFFQAGNHRGTGIANDPAFLDHPSRQGLNSKPASAVAVEGAAAGDAKKLAAGEDTAAAAVATKAAQEAASSSQAKAEGDGEERTGQGWGAAVGEQYEGLQDAPDSGAECGKGGLAGCVLGVGGADLGRAAASVAGAEGEGGLREGSCRAGEGVGGPEVCRYANTSGQTQEGGNVYANGAEGGEDTERHKAAAAAAADAAAADNGACDVGRSEFTGEVGEQSATVFNRYSSAVSGISNALRQWFLRDSSAGSMLDLSQAQSLDIRQAIDTALEAAGPLYRAHYAEWGAVHQHSANVMRGIVGAGNTIADAILRRIAGTVQQAQSAALGSQTSEGMRTSMPDKLPLFPNALTTPLPPAPSVKIFCMYGTGLPTERAYHYLHPNGWTPGKKGNGSTAGNSTCSSVDEERGTCSAGQEQGSTNRFLINTEVHDPERGLDSGIQMQEDGDVTVPLTSLGLMCHRGWRSKRLNPAGMRIVSREYKHVQVPQNLLSNPRGPASAQHVDILGNEEML
ncbi:Lecithin:cholesterol acyltransferase-domain-containing protein, partial [Dunaliella salina]